MAINLFLVIHTLICTNTHYEYACGNMMFVTNVRNTSDRHYDKVNLPLRDIRDKLGQCSHSAQSVCLQTPMNETSMHFLFWVFVMSLEALQME